MRYTLTVTLLFAAILIPFFSSAQSFQQQTIATDKSISDVFMVNTTVGYAGGVDGIYKTINGGQNWELIPYFKATGDFYKDYIPTNFNVVHLHFFNELEGFAYGWHSFNAEIIMATIDGGVTWTVKHYEIPEGIKYNFNHLNSLHVFTNSSMIISGSSGRILRTSDGGEHWTGTRLSEDEEPELNRIEFTSETLGYTAGEDRFYTSSDAGLHWSLHKLNFYINDFHFFDSQNGIAIGNYDSFFETSDGGKTWTKNFMQSEFSIARLNFVDDFTGYATGYSGAIYKTTNGGKAWIKIYLDGNEISSSSLLSPDQIWFSVQKGYLLHSTNGGFISISAPTLVSASPAASGKIGDSITLNGTNLNTVIGVKFNGVAATFKQAGGSIVTEVPRGSTTGKIELIWLNGSVFSDFDFVISKEPLLYYTNITYINRGATTVVQGENLQHITRLNFDGFDFDFVVLNSKEISFVLPSDFTSLNSLPQLNVYSPFGSASLYYEINFAPRITNAVEFPTPGKPMTITGYGFSRATEVKFGNVAVESFEVLNNYQIKCIVPEVSEKITGPIQVTTPGGTGYSVSDYTLYPIPVITSISPLEVKTGEEIKIEGKFLPTSKSFGSVKIGSYELTSYVIRHVDENSLYVKMPEIISGSDVAVTVTNEGYRSTTKNFPITITGNLPYYIESVYPLQTEGALAITVKGFFPHVDSLTVNGMKQKVDQFGLDYLYFSLSSTATSGIITLYANGESFSYPEELIISTEGSAPIIHEFAPKVASVGTKVYLQIQNDQYINSIKVNGHSVPFRQDQNSNYGYANYSITITDSLTSGPISITSPFGIYKTEEILQIKPANQLKAIINSYQTLYQSQGYVVRLIGHNFSTTTGVRFDDFDVDFFVQHDDTLLVKQPNNISSIFFYTTRLTVESPAGETCIPFTLGSAPMQTIESVSPTVGKRGSVLTVKLTPKKPYAKYDNYSQFWVGTTSTSKYIKVDDTTYQIEVPMEGNVEGKIGVAQNGYLQYSDFEFKLGSNDYCTSIGRGPSIFRLKKLLIQGNSADISTEGYIDKTNTPLEVIPGQSLRFGLTPVEYGVATKIFVDWNGDKDFNEPGIFIFDSGTHPPLDSMIHFFLTIPPSTSVGNNVRLRIVTQSYNGDEVIPCGIPNGQVIDYQLNIKASSNVLKVTDFYPTIGKANTRVTVIGDYFTGLQSVTLNGLPLNFSSYMNHQTEVTIPPGATDGELVFNTATQTFTTSRKFIIDNTIEAPDDSLSNFKHMYRATINGNDVGFFTLFNPGTGTIQIYPVQEFPENGTLCVYTPGGEFCFPQPVKYAPYINLPNSIDVKAGQQIIVTGRNLLNVAEVHMQFGYPVSYTLIDEHSLSFIVPESTEPKQYLYFSSPWGSSGFIMNYIQDIPVPPVCDQLTGWYEGGEITQVKFNQISNTSGKNSTGGRSNYSNQVAIVDLYNSYYTDVRVKNFSANPISVSIMVIINGTDTLGRNFDQYGTGGTFTVQLAANEETVLHPYFAIPNSIPTGKDMRIWFALLSYRPLGSCESMIGEIEEYSIHVKKNPVNSPLSISSISQTSTNINEEIVITGTGLEQVKSVQIGGLYVPFTIDAPSSNGRMNTKNNVATATTIRFTVPPQASTGKITITSLNGDAQYPIPLKVIHPHTITSIDPPYGKPGDVILLHGTNLTNVTSLLFDDILVNNFLTFSSNTISVKVPSLGKTGPIRLKNELNEQVNSETFYFCDGTSMNQFCKTAQHITFDALQPVTFSSSPIVLTATASSSLPITFSSSNSSVATISGNTITLVGTGSTEITATQSGNNFYYSATDVVRTLVVNKVNQTITFNTLNPVKYGQSSFLLTANATSSLPILYSSSNTSVATVSGKTVTIVGPGGTIISAKQDGNGFYNPASDVERALVVEKSSQTISFSPVSDKLFSALPITLSASASSGLNVVFTSTQTVTINNTILTSVNPGRVSVRASQNGNNNYESATPVDRSFCIIPLKPVITMSETSADHFTLVSNSLSNNHWFIDGQEMIEAANQSSITVVDNGSYTARVVVDDCMSEFSLPVAVIITAIEKGNSKITTYPNPVKSKMKIQSAEHFTEVLITNMAGQEMKRMITSPIDQAVEIDLSELKNGTFILELREKDKLLYRQKFIKE